MSTAYARPSLCRLCEGPVVANGGVRMAELDLEKLARWWLQEFETELDDDADALCTNPICQFCLWDARFKCEEEMGAEQETNPKLDWWTDHDINNSYKEYYLKYEIRPCRVVIPLLQVPGQETPCEIGGNTADDLAHPRKQPIRKQTDCVYCGETFPTKRAAFWHVTVFHKDVRVFTCSYCVLHFKSRHDWDKHRETCPRAKQNKMKLKSHTLGVNHSPFKETSTNAPNTMEIGQSDNIFLKLVKCIYCNHHIKPKKLSEHCKRVHGPVFIKCIYKKCSKYFFSELEQQKHIEEVHKSRTGCSKCPHCLMTFNAKSFLRHLLSKHPSDIFKCTHKNCSAFFSSKDEQELHMSQKHRQSDKYFNCVYCPNSFTMKDNLYTHVNVIHAAEKIRCEAMGCKVYFKSENELNLHVKEVHERIGSEIIKCPQCPNKIFLSAISLYYHSKRAHQVEKRCRHCQEMVEDTKSHYKVGPCAVCEMQMPCLKMQTSHICNMTQSENILTVSPNINSDDNPIIKPVIGIEAWKNPSQKPTNCAYCGKGFKSRKEAFVHVIQCHRDIQVYQCRKCVVHFKSYSERWMHFKNHHGSSSQIYKCHVCKKQFAIKDNLELHLIERHGVLKGGKNEGHKIGNGSSTEKTDVIKCLYCHAMIFSASFKAHIDLKHSSISIKCIYHRCSKYFLNLEEQQRHIKDIHESKPGLVKCPLCLLKYQKKPLQDHLVWVHASEIVVCSYNKCTSLLCSKEELELHISKFHNSSVKKFTCSYCNKLLASKVTTSRHIRRYHSSEFTDPAHINLNRCEKCNFQSILPSILRQHIRAVHKSWNNQCQVCSKLFKTIQSLYRHENASHGELCRHCGALIFDLNKHYSLGKPCKFCSLEMPCGGMKTDHMRTCEKRK